MSEFWREFFRLVLNAALPLIALEVGKRLASYVALFLDKVEEYFGTFAQPQVEALPFSPNSHDLSYIWN